MIRGGDVFFSTQISFDGTEPETPRFLNVLIDLNDDGWDGTNAEWLVQNYSFTFADLFPANFTTGWFVLRIPVGNYLGKTARVTLSTESVPDGSGAWGALARGETEDHDLSVVGGTFTSIAGAPVEFIPYVPRQRHFRTHAVDRPLPLPEAAILVNYPGLAVAPCRFRMQCMRIADDPGDNPYIGVIRENPTAAPRTLGFSHTLPTERGVWVPGSPSWVALTACPALIPLRNAPFIRTLYFDMQGSFVDPTREGDSDFRFRFTISYDPEEEVVVYDTGPLTEDSGTFGAVVRDGVTLFEEFDGAEDGECPPGWTCNSSSTLFGPRVDGGRLQLANTVVPSAATSVYWNQPLDLSQSAFFSFDVFITDPGEGGLGEGLAFSLIDANSTDPTALGPPGGNLGIPEATGVAVEIDIFDNGAGDPSGYNTNGIAHIAAVENGDTSNPLQTHFDFNPDLAYKRLGGEGFPDVLSGTPIHVEVVCDKDTLQTFVSAPATSHGLEPPVRRTQVLYTESPQKSSMSQALVGFTAATSSATAKIHVDNFFVSLGENPQIEYEVRAFQLVDDQLVPIKDGDRIVGMPGSTVRFSGDILLKTDLPGITGWSYGLRAAGQAIRLGDLLNPGDPFSPGPMACPDDPSGKLCCARTIFGPSATGDEVESCDHLIVDPAKEPETGPLAGSGPQGVGVAGRIQLMGANGNGTLDAGQFSIVQFFIEGTIPQDNQVEEVSLTFLDGLCGAGQQTTITTTNQVSLEPGESVRPGFSSLSFSLARENFIFEVDALGRVVQENGDRTIRIPTSVGETPVTVGVIGLDSRLNTDILAMQFALGFSDGIEVLSAGALASFLEEYTVSGLVHFSPEGIDPDRLFTPPGETPEICDLDPGERQGQGITGFLAFERSFAGNRRGSLPIIGMLFKLKEPFSSSDEPPRNEGFFWKNCLQPNEGPTLVVNTLTTEDALLADDCTSLDVTYEAVETGVGICAARQVLKGLEVNDPCTPVTLEAFVGQSARGSAYVVIESKGSDNVGIYGWTLPLTHTPNIVITDVTTADCCPGVDGEFDGSFEVDIVETVNPDASCEVDGPPQGVGFFHVGVLNYDQSFLLPQNARTPVLRIDYEQAQPFASADDPPQTAMISVADCLQGGAGDDEIEEGLKYLDRFFMGGDGVPPQTVVAPDDEGDLQIIITPRSGSPNTFVRGDANDDGVADLADVVSILGHLFLSDPPANCPDALDANDDEGIDISDPIYLLFHRLVPGSPLPPPPFPECGPDDDDDPCESSSCPP